MRAQGAAPRARDSGAAGLHGDTLSGSGSLAQFDLAPHVQARLAAEGVHLLEDWRRLGKGRFAIFGITRRTAEMLDEAARTQS